MQAIRKVASISLPWGRDPFLPPALDLPGFERGMHVDDGDFECLAYFLDGLRVGVGASEGAIGEGGGGGGAEEGQPVGFVEGGRGDKEDGNLVDGREGERWRVVKRMTCDCCLRAVSQE
jgi:hypothetical protein